MIYSNLDNGYKLKAVQIDPNGLCNAKCWFCPVGHTKNPEFAKTDMPIELFEDIIIQIKKSKGKFVHPLFSFFYSAHYNEILLYKHFDEMLEMLRRQKVKTFILTNGVALTKSKVDKIYEYKDVIKGLLLNIPSADEEEWSKLVGMNKSIFNKVVSNVAYAHEKLEYFTKQDMFHIQVNGIDHLSLTQNGGWVDLLENALDLDLDPETGSLNKSFKALQGLFPNARVYKYNNLYDRAGKLDELRVLTNRVAIDKNFDISEKEVVGCRGGIGLTDRANEWIHINANGDVFLCCDDFDFVTMYGNLKDSSLEDLWFGSNRQDAIKSAKSSLCRNCSAAIWA
jgi:MoaA/NifB/PqqE/SkfB family radical SAM enzyme